MALEKLVQDLIEHEVGMWGTSKPLSHAGPARAWWLPGVVGMMLIPFQALVGSKRSVLK